MDDDTSIGIAFLAPKKKQKHKSMHLLLHVGAYPRPYIFN